MKLEQLYKIFDDLEPKKKELLSPLLEETIFIKTQLDYLKKLPLIRIKEGDPTKQKRTEAAKMLKEYEQIFNNNMKVLLSSLESSNGDEPDDFDNFMKQYENGF